MTKEEDESKRVSKVSRRDFVIRFVMGVIVGAVGVAAAESILRSSSLTGMVTRTVTGPTTTVAGPATTVTAPAATVTAPATTVTGTTTETSTETSTEMSTAAAGGFPTVKVANLNEVSLNTPITFDYPLTDEPNILVKLGQKAEGGIGPDSDIVAFSMICQHQGCQAQFMATSPIPTQTPGPVAFCPCHSSVYDLVNGANVVSGPAPLPLPRVMLGVDESGDIYAYAMGPPVIYGHGYGDDVSADLLG